MNMMQGVTFPYEAHPDSNVIPVIIVEQDNPRRQYTITADRILAIHRCLGAAGADVRLVKRTAKVAAGFEEEEEGAAEDQRTVAQLCREWRLVNAKLAYDVACLPEGKDSDELCTAANQRIFEIEEELAASRIDDLDDAQAVLSIIGKNMDEELMGEDRDRAMLRAVHRGMNHIRNKLAPTT
jgi:hypothetical protein